MRDVVAEGKAREGKAKEGCEVRGTKGRFVRCVQIEGRDEGEDEAMT